MKQKHLMKYYHGNIKIDIDKKKIPKVFYERFEELRNHYPISNRAYTKSPSSKGWHIVIQLDFPIFVAEAILIQIFLCSDIKREFMNFMRVLNGASLEKWNILFNRKMG